MKTAVTDVFERRFVLPRPGRTLVVGSHLYRDREDRRRRYPDALGVDMRARASADRVAELARCRARQAAQMNRTPAWADRKRMVEIYRLARQLTQQTGVPHHVDHEIPLQGRLVSGLHVPENLRVIPAKANLSKGRSFEVSE